MNPITLIKAGLFVKNHWKKLLIGLCIILFLGISIMGGSGSLVPTTTVGVSDKQVELYKSVATEDKPLDWLTLLRYHTVYLNNDFSNVDERQIMEFALKLVKFQITLKTSNVMSKIINLDSRQIASLIYDSSEVTGEVTFSEIKDDLYKYFYRKNPGAAITIDVFMKTENEILTSQSQKDYNEILKTTMPIQFGVDDSEGGVTDLSSFVPEGTMEGFEVTAYTPDPSENGGDTTRTTKSGTHLTPDRSAAVDPSVIPLGTVFEVQGSPYRWVAEDTGGAIKGNRIDICLATTAQADTWGRREGLTITILGSSVDRPMDSSPIQATGMAKAVVDGAIAEMNKHWITYNMEGRDLSRGVMDCSLFTWYIFDKYAHVDIGNNTGEQIDRGKKIMNQADLRPGDLVFFHDTYPNNFPHHVSHVGIYIGNGMMIHDSASHNGVATVGINISAFQGHYLWGERWFQ